MTYLKLTIFHIYLFLLISTSSSEKTITKRNSNDRVYVNGKSPLSFYMAPLGSQKASSSVQAENIQESPSNLESAQQSQPDSQINNQKQVAVPQPYYNIKQPLSDTGSNDYLKYILPVGDVSTEATVGNAAVQPISPPLTNTAFVSASSFLPQFLAQSEIIGLSGTGLQGSVQNGLISSHQPNLFIDAVGTSSFNSYNTPLPQIQPLGNNQAPIRINPSQISYFRNNPLSNNFPGTTKFNIPQKQAFNQQFYQNKQKFPLIYNLPARPTAQSQLQGKVPVVLPHYQKQKSSLNDYQLPPITNGAPDVYHNIETPHVNLVQKSDALDDEKPVNENTDENSNNNEEDTEETVAEEENDEEENEESADEDEKRHGYDDEESHLYETFPFEDEDYIDQKENHHFRPWSDRFGSYDEEINDNYEKHNTGDFEREASEIKSRYHPDQNSSGSDKKENLDQKKKQYLKPIFYKKSDKYGRKLPSKKYNLVKTTTVQPIVDSLMTKNGNPPVTRKQKVYKERWYVSEDIQDGNQAKPKKN